MNLIFELISLACFVLATTGIYSEHTEDKTKNSAYEAIPFFLDKTKERKNNRFTHCPTKWVKITNETNYNKEAKVLTWEKKLLY